LRSMQLINGICADMFSCCRMRRNLHSVSLSCLFLQLQILQVSSYSAQSVSFILSPCRAVLSHTKPASTVTSRDSCRAAQHNKRDYSAVQNCTEMRARSANCVVILQYNLMIFYIYLLYREIIY
jgi:hypothetical protein